MHSELALCLTAEQRGIHDQEWFLKAILLPNYPCKIFNNEYDFFVLFCNWGDLTDQALLRTRKFMASPRNQ